MSSLSRNFLLLICLLSALYCRAEGTVRICADPDNLPFSNQQRAGFDNHIAELLVHKMGKTPVFVWARARRGFLRERFNHGDCDLLMGVPQGLKHVRQTTPYYRSTYVFVTRKEDNLSLSGFNDPAIGKRRIGLQILEADFSPPSLPLIRYGHTSQLVGFESFGAHSADIIHAVAKKNIGMAVVWGPLAGFYVAREKNTLTLIPVHPAIDAGVPFQYSMTIAVPMKNPGLVDSLNHAIESERSQIHHILTSYHVPEVETKEGVQ